MAVAASGQVMPGGASYFGIGIAVGLVVGALALYVAWWQRRQRRQRSAERCKQRQGTVIARLQPRKGAKAVLMENPLRKKRVVRREGLNPLRN